MAGLRKGFAEEMAAMRCVLIGKFASLCGTLGANVAKRELAWLGIPAWSRIVT
jgi:hypothetical protein